MLLSNEQMKEKENYLEPTGTMWKSVIAFNGF